MLFPLREHREHSFGAHTLGLSAQSLGQPLRRRVADDDDAIGLPHSQALANNSLDGPFQVAHRSAA
jgi:hypothetical protein